MKKYYRVVVVKVAGQDMFRAQWRLWFLPFWEEVSWSASWSLEEAEKDARDHASKHVIKNMGAL